MFTILGEITMLPINHKDSFESSPRNSTPFHSWLVRQHITGVLHTRLVVAVRLYLDVPKGTSNIGSNQLAAYREILLSFLEDYKDKGESILHALSQGYDATKAYMDKHDGKVSIVYTLFTRPEILNVSYHLNLWNANQPVTDAEHRKHYQEYIQPVNDWLMSH